MVFRHHAAFFFALLFFVLFCFLLHVCLVKCDRQQKGTLLYWQKDASLFQWVYLHLKNLAMAKILGLRGF